MRERHRMYTIFICAFSLIWGLFTTDSREAPHSRKTLAFYGMGWVLRNTGWCEALERSKVALYANRVESISVGEGGIPRA